MPAAKPLQNVAQAFSCPFPSPLPPEEHQGVHQLLILRRRLSLDERLSVGDLSVVVPRHT